MEVAALPVQGPVVGARDSKNPGGPVLGFSAAEWGDFLGAIKRGRFG